MSQLTIRLPDELRIKLERAAHSSRRSLNAEILLRLESEKIPGAGSENPPESPRAPARAAAENPRDRLRESPRKSPGPDPAAQKIPGRPAGGGEKIPEAAAGIPEGIPGVPAGPVCHREGCELERDGASPFCADHRVRPPA